MSKTGKRLIKAAKEAVAIARGETAPAGIYFEKSSVLEDPKLFLLIYRMFIEEYWGERCQDFDPACACCKAWRRYDEERAACLD